MKTRGREGPRALVWHPGLDGFANPDTEAACLMHFAWKKMSELGGIAMHKLGPGRGCYRLHVASSSVAVK